MESSSSSQLHQKLIEQFEKFNIQKKVLDNDTLDAIWSVLVLKEQTHTFDIKFVQYKPPVNTQKYYENVVFVVDDKEFHSPVIVLQNVITG
jgi:hypothetical protein